MLLLLLGACGIVGALPDLDRDGWNAGDCDALDASVAPDAPELADGIDNDCDGHIDEGTRLADDDGDGTSEDAGDCDDGDAAIGPDAAEVADDRDQDCDGLVDEGTDNVDDDGDGWAEVDGDCADDDPGRYPRADELCDEVDQDCDGLADEPFDADGDGWTSCAGDLADLDPTVYPEADELCDGVDNDQDGDVDEVCDQDGDGVTALEGDCDDGRDDVYPDALEACDEVDNDCDGFPDEADEDADDPDRDGFACTWDCDEASATRNPEAHEAFNGADDDCDGEVDEGFDLDGDGYAEDDCDDLSADRFPGQNELCNGQDDDCDGLADEGYDADEDGALECEGDCDDTDPLVGPDATERVNAEDDDCDGVVDDDAGLLVAAQQGLTLGASESATTSLPLPLGEWDEWVAFALIESWQDASNGFCDWATEATRNGDSVDVTVALDECTDNDGWGFAVRYSVVLFAVTGDDTDLDTQTVGGGASTSASSATASISASGGSTLAVLAAQTWEDNGDRDISWDYACTPGGGSYTCTTDMDHGNGGSSMDGTMVLVGGFENATVDQQSFEVQAQTTTSVSYDSDEPDHLVLVDVTGHTSNTENHVRFLTERAISSDGETLTMEEFGTEGDVRGQIIQLDGDFLYWLNGSWTY